VNKVLKILVANLHYSIGMGEGEKGKLNANKRITLTLLTKRHNDRADQYISSKASADFPK
jgi:hypothetical protein